MPRTRILATIGPASSDAETIAALLDAGADAFRLNFSHGSIESHQTAPYRCVFSVNVKLSFFQYQLRNLLFK